MKNTPKRRLIVGPDDWNISGNPGVSPESPVENSVNPVEGNPAEAVKPSRAQRVAYSQYEFPKNSPESDRTSVAAPEVKESAPLGGNWDWGELAIGIAPTLAGYLSGDTASGYSVAGRGLQDRQKQLIQLNQAKIKNLRENKPLTKSNVIETVGPDGKPLITPIESAIGQTAYRDEASGFNLDDKMRLESHKAKLKSKDTGDTFKNERDLRGDYSKDPITKNTKSRMSSFSTIKKLYSSPQTGANDLSMVFAYMKMLDPGSVVREGEQATARNSGSVPDNVRQLYNRMLTGKDALLHETVRKNFATEASNLYDSQLEMQSQVDRDYDNMASRYKLNPENVTVIPSMESGIDTGKNNKLPPVKKGTVQIRYEGDLIEVPKHKANSFLKEFGGEKIQ